MSELDDIKKQIEKLPDLPLSARIQQAMESDDHEFKVDPSIAAQASEALAAIKLRPFSERNPHLGKMIKCGVCQRRHRANPPCTPKYKSLYIEEDLDTGKKTEVFATVPLPGQRPTIKTAIGAARFKGKRKKQRPSHNHLEVVEIVKDLYGRDEPYDRNNPEHLQKLNKLRAKGVGIWKERRRAKARAKRRQQDISRRINRGLTNSR